MDAGDATTQPNDGTMALRARLKLATRDAISAAALRLAVEHGPENVRVQDIAAAAGVSPRTYNNYFASREQAICAALAAEQALRVGAALRARPADEPLGEAITEAMVEQYDAQPDRQAIALITGTPALQGEYLKTYAAIEDTLTAAIAARTGADDPADLRSRVLAATTAGAARVAVEHWLHCENDESFTTVLRDALSALR